jgi:hypothetical protein
LDHPEEQNSPRRVLIFQPTSSDLPKLGLSKLSEAYTLCGDTISDIFYQNSHAASKLSMIQLGKVWELIGKGLEGFEENVNQGLEEVVLNMLNNLRGIISSL